MDQSPLSSCVDAQNFPLVYHYIHQHRLISDAAFIAFDLEMTGIKGDYLDTFEEYPFERFYKMRKVAQKFTIIQLGLCFFVPHQNGYLSYPFTFYLFPSDEDSVIGLQVGAIKFNNSNNMDWNRWIYHGISYLNEKSLSIATEKNIVSQQDKTQEQVQEKIQQDDLAAKSMKDNMKQEDKHVTEDYINQITQWINSDSKTLEIDVKNAYHKKYLYSYIGSTHPSIYVKTVDGVYTLRKVNEDEKLELDKKNKLEQEIYFQKKQGFSKLWTEIKNSKKPMVGHNCFADLLFIYSHFIDRLPPSYEMFKTEFNQRFNTIYDTKYLFNHAESLQKLRESYTSDSTVDNLLQLVQKDLNNVKFSFPEELQTYALKAQSHEAGYDAYMTGIIFAEFSHLLTPEELKKEANKINIYKSNQIIYLEGEDELISKKTLFFIKLPELKNTKNNQKQQLQKNQDSLSKLENHFAEYQQNQVVQTKQIHLKYFLIDIKSEDEAMIEEIEDHARDFCNKNADYVFMLEKSYRLERKDMKEKEVKFEKFDKK